MKSNDSFSKDENTFSKDDTFTAALSIEDHSIRDPTQLSSITPVLAVKDEPKLTDITMINKNDVSLT